MFSMERGRGAASAGRGGLQAQEGQSRGCRVKSAWGHQEQLAKARKAASLPTPSCSMSRGPQRTLAPEELSGARKYSNHSCGFHEVLPWTHN